MSFLVHICMELEMESSHVIGEDGWKIPESF